jgi:hypothetical protein
MLYESVSPLPLIISIYITPASLYNVAVLLMHAAGLNKARSNDDTPELDKTSS